MKGPPQNGPVPPQDQVAFRTSRTFSHSPRTICTVLLDPRDPLLQSERTQGYTGPRLRKGEVFAYVGLPQNLEDLKVAGELNLKDLKDP